MNGEDDPFSTLNSDNSDSVPTEWLRRALLTEHVPKAFNSSALGHCSTWTGSTVDSSLGSIPPHRTESVAGSANEK